MALPEPQQSLRPDRERPTLLVVDDEPVIRRLVADLLETDYLVLDAPTAEAALALLQEQPADLVLTDVLLPGRDGIALLQALKQKDPELPVIVMTGYADRETVLRALQAHADDFIDKPINALQLQTTVKRALEQRALRAEVRRFRHLDQLHTRFLGLISHKLKTPVTAIGLVLQQLARSVGDDRRNVLSLALGEVKHLGSLIEDLLYFSETLLADRPFRQEPVELQRLAAQVAEELRPNAAERGAQLQLDLPAGVPSLSLDRERTRFVLRALVDNAIKFSAEGGHIDINVRAEAGAVALAVRDRGPGIPDEELERVFDRFYQIDPGDTGQVRGFGLGLYYAREFVRAQGGEIELFSCPGEGTTARIRFPLPQASS